MTTTVVLILIVVIGLQLLIRLTPSQAENWVITPSDQPPGTYPTQSGFRVIRDIDGAQEDFEVLFDQAMLEEPRTRKLGQVQGQHVYVSRTAFWGFPDYTTLAMQDGRAEIHARLRFGKSDMGINRARLERVLSRVDWIVPE